MPSVLFALELTEKIKNSVTEQAETLEEFIKKPMHAVLKIFNFLANHAKDSSNNKIITKSGKELQTIIFLFPQKIPKESEKPDAVSSFAGNISRTAIVDKTSANRGGRFNTAPSPQKNKHTVEPHPFPVSFEYPHDNESVLQICLKAIKPLIDKTDWKDTSLVYPTKNGEFIFPENAPEIAKETYKEFLEKLGIENDAERKKALEELEVEINSQIKKEDKKKEGYPSIDTIVSNKKKGPETKSKPKTNTNTKTVSAPVPVPVPGPETFFSDLSIGPSAPSSNEQFDRFVRVFRTFAKDSPESSNPANISLDNNKFWFDSRISTTATLMKPDKNNYMKISAHLTSSDSIDTAFAKLVAVFLNFVETYYTLMLKDGEPFPPVEIKADKNPGESEEQFENKKMALEFVLLMFNTASMIYFYNTTPPEKKINIHQDYEERCSEMHAEYYGMDVGPVLEKPLASAAKGAPVIPSATSKSVPKFGKEEKEEAKKELETKLSKPHPSRP